uniref:TLC domain-containing protein n=1 Tax=Leersia perrieri TaxID=77586 RepID=A0A0D9Y1S9_9ORYZ
MAAATAAYWLAEHPSIVSFRWSPTGLWFSTWAFLLTFLASYVTLCLTLDAILAAVHRRRHRPLPLPLGPIPAAHAFLMAAVSAVIFAGMLLSALAEIRDTRWSWRGRSRTTPFRWLLCFPPGTRSSGRVFFWSYAYYLSRYLHAARGLLAVLARRRRGATARVFAHAASVAMAFLWLEFSQSFQVLAILASTLAHAVAFGFRFLAGAGAGLPAAGARGVALACQCALLGCNLLCHVGVVWMHFGGVAGGGCSGIGAWVFNSLLNAALLWVFLHCYAKRGVCDDDGSNKKLM